MPTVNPAILTWARDSAGLTRTEAAQKLQIRPAYGKTAVERLDDLESGTWAPTGPMLRKMARQYMWPLITFYLAEPPLEDDDATDFRSLAGSQPPRTNAQVRALVRNIMARQSMLRDVLEDDEEPEVAFVGALKLDDGERTALELTRKVLGAKDPSQASNADQAFRQLRDAAHAAGIFVLLKGDLGSHHSALPVEAFRGFALADRLAPFIVINDNDARTAWSFTLVHELVHLFLGNTGISDSPFGAAGATVNRVERFCNDVASEFLLPEGALAGIDDGRMPPEALAAQIETVADAQNVSRSLVAYRLLRADRIGHSAFRSLVAEFRAQWQRAKRTRRAAAAAAGGGPSYYNVKRHRVGAELLEVVRRAHANDDLPTRRAAFVLDVKPTQLGAMLAS